MKMSSSNGRQPLRNETAVIKDEICEDSCEGIELTNRRFCTSINRNAIFDGDQEPLVLDGMDETVSPGWCKSLTTLSLMLRQAIVIDNNHIQGLTKGGLFFPYLLD